MKRLIVIVVVAVLATATLVIMLRGAGNPAALPGVDPPAAAAATGEKRSDPIAAHLPQPAETVPVYRLVPELPPLPPPRNTTIEFPDGTLVDVTMKAYRPQPPPFTGWKKLIHVYDALVEEAESGDVAAARVLYRSLRNCDEAYTDRESFDIALEVLERDGIEVYPSGKKSSPMIHDSQEMTISREMMAESFEMCEGITAAHNENRIRWAEMAAQGGDYWSIQEMAQQEGFTPAGIYWHEQAWLNGHAGAADSLSIYYRNGAADPEYGQPDYLRSYAYLFINHQVYVNALSQSSSPLAMNRVVSMENILRHHGSFLSPEQQAAAERMAAQLLQENENCCLGGWQLIGR